MGLAAARQLSAKGANIVIAARSVDKLESAIKEIQVRRAPPNNLLDLEPQLTIMCPP
jgi:NADP-dependent 3-hydroxy acid dehydrogenase YdfG